MMEAVEIIPLPARFGAYVAICVKGIILGKTRCGLVLSAKEGGFPNLNL